MLYATHNQDTPTDVIANMIRDVDTRPAIGGLTLYAAILAIVVVLEVLF